MLGGHDERLIQNFDLRSVAFVLRLFPGSGFCRELALVQDCKGYP